MTHKIFNRASLRAGAAPLALGIALVAAAPAFAQAASTAAAPAADAAPAEQEIVVTGTLFRNASAATASPVTVLSSEDLAKRGINTISDAVQSISANNAGSMNQNWTGFNFATGATAVSLRGLTTGNTLTIFDGLRTAPYPLADDGHRNFVDLNTIPQGIVDHIDVLQDGASSTYGADAVAGVVNVIIKKEIRGLHVNASSGISQRGDAGEQRIDATAGYGSLSENNFNAYVNVEYQKNDPLYARDRGYPYNTADLSRICASGTICMNNGILSGIQSNGTFLGLGSTKVPFVRPYNAAGTGAIPGSRFQMLNPSAGCGTLKAQTLTAAQQTNTGGNAGGTAPSVVCQEDLVQEYSMEQPRTSRFGTTGRVTANVGSRAQAYAMINYYQTKTFSQISPLNFAGQTAAGGNIFVNNPLLLPVYVCPRNTVGACTATNGTLNPNNPFASLGEQARLSLRYDRPRQTFTNSQAFRYTAGINGSFGDDWQYTADVTKSHVALKVTNKNYFFAQHILDVVKDGSYNFVNPLANTEAQREYVAPTNVNRSSSDLWQAQATLGKSLFQLPGGPLQVAVGAAYRHEAIDNPSANAPNNDAPANRYYSINAVGVEGSRNVKSAFFEIDAPVVDMVHLKGSGRYDKYSSGQKNFSPKLEAEFKPIRQLKLRGTYSRGFRIPSFNEAYGLPTTGYITAQLNPSVPAQKAFIDAHGGNAYATQQYSYGLTATGNASLKPEKSRAFTAGIVFEPISRVSLTVDYWNIHIKNLISNADYSGVITQYYANNGVVNIPGIVVTPGLTDPDHPTALPLLGDIAYSFENANKEIASGIDFSAQARFSLGGVRWTTKATASYLKKLEKIIGGEVQRYDGTLSPCDVTSCSGAPRWRGTWQNTFDMGKATLSLTTYYTGGYDLASTDYGGKKGDCANNVGASVVTYNDGVTPVRCRGPKFIVTDMTAGYQVNDKLNLYVNVLNLFDKKAPFDPSAAYSLYQYNPAWASSGFTGRYFRVGARVDF